MEVDQKEGPKMRAITSELNVLTRSDGSAIIAQGLYSKIYFFIFRLTFFLFQNLFVNIPAHIFYFVGGSCCIASVNGPLEVSPANLDMNKAYVDVIYRPKSGLPGVNERYKEKIVKSLCETTIVTQLYPRTQITVQTQEMDDHGGVS